jgi:putative adenylate-forming enzyme
MSESSRAIFATWLSARMAIRQSAAGLARRRDAAWARMAPTLAATPALSDWAGHPLAGLPITDIADLRADYGRWNSLGLTHDALMAAAHAAEAGGSGEVLPGIVAGFSTGSSGTRGLFVASATERADYIGQSLARLLRIRALLRPQRIALFLRANSRIYSDVGTAHMRFRHFALDEDPASLTDFNPTIIIAPAHKLLEIAQIAQARAHPLPALRHLFSGSEPMSAAERAWIGERLSVRPDPIYQATEGFLAGACRFGQLHLNDHAMVIELEPVPGTAGFRPIITDLHRHSQPIIRVRGDDFLELDPAFDAAHPCPCGYAGRVIAPVGGRVNALWRFAETTLAPGDVADHIDHIIGVPTRWTAFANAAAITITIDAMAQVDAHALATRFAAHPFFPVPVTLIRAPIAAPDAAKSPKRTRIFWA